MTNDRRAREYLLGTLAEEERDALEKQYFAADAGLDRVSAAEDELIEDYLERCLTEDERASFENQYLESPSHRVRVETVRRLMERAQAGPLAEVMPVTRRRLGWFDLAAAAVLLVAAGLWTLNQQVSPYPAAPTGVKGQAERGAAPAPAQPEPPAKPSAAPAIFAIELTPLAVRSAGDAPRFTIPAETELVELALESPESWRSTSSLSVTVATLSGHDVWHGAAAPAGLVAHARLPANALSPEDYIVTVRDGQVATRYFLRIRSVR